VLWLVIWLLFQRVTGVPFAVVFGPMFGPAYVLTIVAVALCWMTTFPAWGPWGIARAWLLQTGRLPWRLMEFLKGAHRLGVLRQSGGVYQFRHARLQHHLATQPNN
jgi:hypothetical protein